MEIWKPVKNFENLYEVSNLGRVKSLTREVYQTGNGGKIYTHTYPEKILKGSYDKVTGYRKLCLYKQGKPTIKYVHRLVAEVFCEKPNNIDKLVVDHKNGRKLDNRANNLRWVTQKENIKNAIIQGHDYGKQITTGVYNNVKCSIYCIELNKSFDTLRNAAIYLKDKESLSTPWQTIKKNIHYCCKRPGHTAYKYHWKFN